jgi:hypothetical protein
LILFFTIIILISSNTFSYRLGRAVERTLWMQKEAERIKPLPYFKHWHRKPDD